MKIIEKLKDIKLNKWIDFFKTDKNNLNIKLHIFKLFISYEIFWKRLKLKRKKEKLIYWKESDTERILNDAIEWNTVLKVVRKKRYIAFTYAAWLNDSNDE